MMRCFCDSKMDQDFFYESSFKVTTPKSAAYAQERRSPGRTRQTSILTSAGARHGLTPDKKEARGDRGTGSDASAALAALDG